MARIQIPIGGITTTSAYKDGDLYSSVNLRKKNGALHPVAPRKVEQTLSAKYDIIFVHSVNDTDNWIGVVHNSTHSSIYHTIKGTRVLIGSVDLFSKINAIEQIGNTLSVISSETIAYLLWDGTTYKVLGEIPEIPSLNLSGIKNSTTQRYQAPTGTTSITVTNQTTPIVIDIISFLNGATVISTIGAYAGMYYINGITSVDVVTQLVGDTSFLTDGLIKKSYYTLYPTGTITSSNFVEKTIGLANKLIADVNDIKIDTTTVATGLGSVGGYYTFNDAFGGLQLYDAHFVRYAFKLYDGTVIKHSSPILVCGPDALFDMKKTDYWYNSSANTLETGTSYVTIKCFRLAMQYSLAGLADWKDIIKSIDIYLSPALGVTSTENLTRTFLSVPNTNYSEQLLNDIQAKTKTFIKEMSTFYLVKSIPVDEESSYQIFPSSNTERDNLKNLLFQEVMTDDNFTHHGIGANKSYVYNGRLNVADIKTTLFRGFGANHFRWGGNYNGTSLSGSFGNQPIYIEVELNINGIIHTVRHGETTDYEDFQIMGAFISYPDSRATKLTVLKKTASNKALKKVYKLTPHSFLNLSYYVDENLTRLMASATLVTYTNFTDTDKVVVSEPSKLKTSSLNNPFNFPSINTYTVGSGKITGIMSNAMRTSDGQFGQYPIYVFTNERIYALNVGSGDVVYSSITPISQETPISDIICSTPFGVVFIGNRGLFTINGQQVDFISSQLEQAPLPLRIIETIATVDKDLPTLTNQAIQNYTQDSFIEYLSGITNIFYNPLEKELIICNNGYAYNYVLNVDSQSYYQSTENIDIVVGNTYPNVYVTENLTSTSKLKDFYLPEPSTQVNVSFITRPITFGPLMDVKRLDRIILRARIDNATKMAALTHNSDDGIEFKVRWGMDLKPSYYRDIITPLLPKNKHRQFLYAWGGTVDATSQINFFEADVIDEYNNDKMK